MKLFYYKKIQIIESIDELSIKKWFSAINGNLKSLLKSEIKRDLTQKETNLLNEKLFEFKAELSKETKELTEKILKLSLLNALYQLNGNYRDKNKANDLKYEIEQELKVIPTKKSKINIDDFISYIELTFGNIGSINTDQTSTSYAYKLYDLAINKNRKIQSHGNNKQ